MHLPGTWTLNLVRQLWPIMTVGSMVRYRSHVLQRAAEKLRPGDVLDLRLRRPFACTVHLRVDESDVGTFNEIFVAQVYRTVVEHVRGCRAIIDLGGNIGLAAVYLSAHYPEARIFCVEPGAPALQLLDRHVRQLPQAARISTLRGAVWGSACELETDSSAAPYSNALTVREASAPGADRVAGYPIGDVMARAGFDYVDLLKVDIEGAERQLFTGDLTWLDRVGAIAIEFHGTSRADIDFDALMAERGFALYDTRHTTLAIRTGAGSATQR